MAKIEGIGIKNFRCLKDIRLGKLWYGSTTESAPLTAMTVVIGKNGVGKSTLFDAFGFLADALKYGVEEACNLRGGFEKIISKGQSAELEFAIAFKEDSGNLLCYILSINLDQSKRPVVKDELLFHTENNDRSLYFLHLSNGIGFTASDKTYPNGFDLNLIHQRGMEGILVGDLNKAEEGMADEMANQGVSFELNDKTKLGLATIGAINQHERISLFRQFIEDWYLSYFTPDAARSLPSSGTQQHLNSKGDNLANVVQFMEREHRDSFQSILDRISEKIPGIDKIRTEKTSDGRLLLCFNDQGFQDPFYAPQMSDGTLKVFAYLLLLEDPNPPPFICIEEPENGLYHKLLETLAAEFRAHATGREGSSQLFITTHQPYFVDALEPEEVWILEKGEDGFSTIRRASDDELVKNMVAEGLPLGGLWYSDYLDAR